MLACIQQMLAFATFEVLEPNWRKLEGKLEAGKVETVDQLLREHVDFLDTCLKECMLTSRKLITVSSFFRVPPLTSESTLTLGLIVMFKDPESDLCFRDVQLGVVKGRESGPRHRGFCRMGSTSSQQVGDP